MTTTCEQLTQDQKRARDFDTLLAFVDDQIFVYAVKRGWSSSVSDARIEGRAALDRLRAEATKVPELEAWREEMLHALSLGLDYTPKAEEAANRLRGIITGADASEQRAVDAEQERDGALEAVRDARSTLAVLAGTHSISEQAYQELACHLDDEPLGADGGRITTRAERAEYERDALKARLDQVGNAVQVGVEYDVANRDAAREQVADLSAENAALVAERDSAEARVKELTAALEHEVVQWSGDRSWCRRCRTEQPQVPSPRVPHQHADRCPLAGASYRPAPAPPALVDAVGPVVACIRDFVGSWSSQPATTVAWDAGLNDTSRPVTLGHLRTLLTAYDASKGPQDDATADLRRVLELTRTGSHVGDTATELGEKAVQAVRALLGDAQKWWTAKARGEDRAELARVIDVEAEELGVTIAYQSLTSLACAVGSHIIGDDGTEPAATVSKARLVDVLRTRRDAARGSEDRAREWGISRLRAHHAGARDMAEAIAQDLHLTLDTSPSGPKPEPEDRQFEAWAQGQRESDARRYEWVRARRASPPVAPKSSTPLLLAKNPVNSTPVPAAARPPCRPTPLPDVPGLAQEPIVDTAALARAMSEPDAPGEDEGHG